MPRETIATALDTASVEAQIARIRQAHERKLATLRYMPGHLPVPTISNESDTEACASWGKGYVSLGDEPDQNYAVLAALETAGYIAMPMSLVQWDNYRRSPEPYTEANVPDTKGRYKLTNADRACPLWIRINQYMGVRIEAFYRAPDGRQLRIDIDLPLPANVYAKRVETQGAWHYEQGSGRLSYPEAWKALKDADGKLLAEVSPHSRAWIDTPQGLDGAIYWKPLGLQEDFPFTPAQMLVVLTNKGGR